MKEEILSFLFSFIIALFIVISITTALRFMIGVGVYKPRDYYYREGFNWFGSWTIFILWTIFSLPFYIPFAIVVLVHRFVNWLFTLGR